MSQMRTAIESDETMFLLFGATDTSSHLRLVTI